MPERRGFVVAGSALVGVAMIVAALALMAAPASAFHIPGATYNGQVSGGGTISFSV